MGIEPCPKLAITPKRAMRVEARMRPKPQLTLAFSCSPRYKGN